MGAPARVDSGANNYYEEMGRKWISQKKKMQALFPFLSTFCHSSPSSLFPQPHRHPALSLITILFLLVHHRMVAPWMMMMIQVPANSVRLVGVGVEKCLSFLFFCLFLCVCVLSCLARTTFFYRLLFFFFNTYTPIP